MSRNKSIMSFETLSATIDEVTAEFDDWKSLHGIDKQLRDTQSYLTVEVAVTQERHLQTAPSLAQTVLPQAVYL